MSQELVSHAVGYILRRTYTHDLVAGGGGRGLIFSLPHASSSLTKHPFGDGAPFLLLTETPPTFERSLRFFQIIVRKHCLFAYPNPCPVSPSVATIYLLGRKRGFSRDSPVYQTLPSHSSNFLISSNTSRSLLVYFTFSYHVSPPTLCCCCCFTRAPGDVLSLCMAVVV